MEKETEEQILKELKNINQSLQNINERSNDKKAPSIISDVIRYLLIGFLIVGPAIAVVMVIFQFVIG